MASTSESGYGAKLQNAQTVKNFITSFNTPRYRFNAGFSNSGLGKDKRVGFNAVYRWQDSFFMEGDFANGNVESFGTVDAQMQPTGSDVEAARLLAAHLGVPLEIVPATGPSRIPLLLTGKVDAVMSSFSITEERKKVVAFSLPYGIIQIICAAVRSETPRSRASVDTWSYADSMSSLRRSLTSSSDQK